MTPVFADTYYYLALLNRKDSAHARAMGASLSLRSPTVTTAWILTELADAMAEGQWRQEAAKFVRRLQANPQVRVIPPAGELFEQGLQLYENRPDKDWSLTDCISFVVMRQEGLADALTGDRHFEQAGFSALLK